MPPPKTFNKTPFMASHERGFCIIGIGNMLEKIHISIGIYSRSKPLNFCNVNKLYICNSPAGFKHLCKCAGGIYGSKAANGAFD